MHTGRRSGWKWCLFANVLGNIPIKLFFQIWMETRLPTAAYTLIMMICRINWEQRHNEETRNRSPFSHKLL